MAERAQHPWWWRFLLMAGLVLVIIAGANLAILGHSEKVIRAGAREHLDSEVERMAGVCAASVETLLDNLELWSRNSVMVRILDADLDFEIAELVDTTLAQTPYLHRLSCWSADGRLIAAAGEGAVAPDLEGLPWVGTVAEPRATIAATGDCVLITVPVVWQFDQPEILGTLNAWVDAEYFLGGVDPWWSRLETVEGVVVASQSEATAGASSLDHDLLRASAEVRLPDGVRGPHWRLTIADRRDVLHGSLPVMRAMVVAMTLGAAALVLALLARFAWQQNRLLEQIRDHADRLESAMLARQQAAEALAASEARFRALTENTDDITLIVDQTGVARYGSPSLASFGYDETRVEGLRPEQYIHHDDLESMETCLRLAIENPGETIALPDFRILHRESQWRILTGVMTSLLGVSGVDGVAVSCRDVTEQRRMEKELEQARRLESLGVLAGGIAHDFNNILTALIGNLSLARALADAEDPIFQQLIDAEQATRRTKRLTEQLLTFSKGGALIKENASVTELVRETALFSLRGSNVRCELELPADLWRVTVDVGQISQVVQNLVINADQAMPEGEVLTIAGANRELADNEVGRLPAGRYVVLRFTDRGCGIDHENLERIFEPYFTTKSSGSGLGLATTYSIIAKHGGHIGVESVVGEGTTFTVYLPAAAAEAAAAEPAAPAEAMIGGAARGLGGRVLLMDDEAVIRKVAGRMLEVLGFEATTCVDGAELLEIYDRERAEGRPFDAVIMDLTVPGGMGGAAAIRHLRERDPEVKAIVSSGYSEDPLMSGFGDHGFVDMIRKPYDLDDFARVLGRVLRPAEEESPKT